MFKFFLIYNCVFLDKNLVTLKKSEKNFIPKNVIKFYSAVFVFKIFISSYKWLLQTKLLSIKSSKKSPKYLTIKVLIFFIFNLAYDGALIHGDNITIPAIFILYKA